MAVLVGRDRSNSLNVKVLVVNMVRGLHLNLVATSVYIFENSSVLILCLEKNWRIMTLSSLSGDLSTSTHGSMVVRSMQRFAS